LSPFKPDSKNYDINGSNNKKMEVPELELLRPATSMHYGKSCLSVTIFDTAE
jgi:hypothetical protein